MVRSIVALGKRVRWPIGGSNVTTDVKSEQPYHVNPLVLRRLQTTALLGISDVGGSRSRLSYILAAGGTFSGDTERTVQSNFAVYAAWCDAYGLRPLPGTAGTVAAFIDTRVKTRTPLTVRRNVANSAVAHRAISHDKTEKSQPVKLAPVSMFCSKGQALALTWPLRECPYRATEAPADRDLQQGPSDRSELAALRGTDVAMPSRHPTRSVASDAPLQEPPPMVSTS